MTTNRVLIYGIGNPGLRDDGLGPRLIQCLEAKGINGVDLDCNYQLNIEDALICSHYEVVIFVDSSENAASPCEFNDLEPAREISFTTHEMAPASVLSLTEELYGRRPKAWLLAVRGFQWDLAEGLSPEAERNLEESCDLLLKHLRGLGY